MPVNLLRLIINYIFGTLKSKKRQVCMVTGERDLRSSDLCGIVDNVAARSKSEAARVDARGSRFSIVPRPARPAHVHTTISTVTTVRFVPSTRPVRSASARAKYAQRKPTIFEPVIVYKRPTYNGHKLFGRNILRNLFLPHII